MAWFKRDKKSIEQSTPPEERRVRTEGLWVKCDSCRTIVFRKDLEANLHVCPKCQFHFKMNAGQRLEMLLDGRWTEHDAGMTSTDPLKFVDTKPYAARLKEAKKKLGRNDAVVTVEGQLNGRPVVLCAMEFGFIGGSMGAVVGEKVTRGIELAIETRQPFIAVSCSGGARMMEGAVSLMQLAKVSAALARLDEEKLPYISVLTDPTPASPCSATSTSANPARSSASPAHASLNRPSGKSSPKAFSAPNSSSNTAFSTLSSTARTSSPSSPTPSIFS